MTRGLPPPAVALIAALAVPAPLAAEPVPVDLELILAVDVSRSMEADEQVLQRQGYVAAFRHPDIIAAIEGLPLGRVGVTYFEWSDAGFQRIVAPWTLIANADDAERFAAGLAAAPISSHAGTSISSSFFFAANRFYASPFRGDRRTIDISGDGPNNVGMPLPAVRDWLLRQGVTVNGLPIMLHTNYSFGPFEMPDLGAYYRDCVIGGPGAFYIPVTSADTFASAIQRKLVLEIAGLPPRLMFAAETQPAEKADCLAGEKARKAYIIAD